MIFRQPDSRARKFAESERWWLGSDFESFPQGREVGGCIRLGVIFRQPDFRAMQFAGAEE